MRSKTVALKIEDLNIVGRLYRPDGRPPSPTVCICHGIPADNPDPTDKGYASLARRLSSRGLAVFTFNFRGTGASDGNLDILGWTRDLEAVISYLSGLPEVDNSCLLLLGFSAGAAVSIHVAARDSRVSAVAACASPAEFAFAGKFKAPGLLLEHLRHIGVIRDNGFPHSVEEWLNGFKEVSPIKYVAGISPRPLLLVHGSADEVVDISHARRLYAGAREPKKLVIVEGAGHRLREDSRVVSIVLRWLKSQICSGFT